METLISLVTLSVIIMVTALYLTFRKKDDQTGGH